MLCHAGLLLKIRFKRCSIYLPFCWTTRSRRRRHSLILRPNELNYDDSARHSSMIASLSCSMLSNCHRNTLAAAGLHTLHNLLGSSLDSLMATSQDR